MADSYKDGEWIPRDVKVVKGQTFKMIFVPKSGGVIIDQTGWVWEFDLKENNFEGAPIVGATITNDIPTGAVSVTIPHAVTAAIVAEKLVYNIWFTDASGERFRLYAGNAKVVST